MLQSMSSSFEKIVDKLKPPEPPPCESQLIRVKTNPMDVVELPRKDVEMLQ